MDFEEAIKILDGTVFARKKFHLKDVEVLILRGAWQGKKYYEIAEASGYTATYLQQDIGPKLWKLISEVLEEKVSKTNFQAALQRHWLASVKSVNSSKTEDVTSSRAATFSQDTEENPAFNSEEELSLYNKLNFVGREKAIADLNNIFKQGAKIILVQGEGGIGKSLLSWEYLTNQGFDVILEHWMAKETANITDPKSVVEEWLKRHFQEEAAGDFSFGLEKLRQKLQDRTKRVAAIIDNLEPALDKDGKFIPPHRDFVELLRVLANPSGNCVTLITSRERLGESAVSFHDYRLEGLDLQAWQQFFSSRQIKTDSPALSAMHQAYGGNAKAMHILSGAIQIDWEGDIDAYWQTNEKNLLGERDLEDLVVSQFNRLQELDPEAYKLLCRLGCYRYQDVRSLFLDGVLHLLWDVPESQRRRVVKSLRDRSLLDFYKGEHWLHSVTKAEAITRLKASNEWEITHQKAAEFWTESVKTIQNVEDALKALEAYYHYKEIKDFNQACQVLLKERQPSSQTIVQAESLSMSLARLGFLQHVNHAINQIIDYINDDYILSILYGDLGGNYHRLGDMQTAIKYYRATKEKAIKCLDSMPEETMDTKIKYEIDRRIKGVGFTIGHCKLNLGEIQKAIEAYEETIQLCENTNFHIFAIWSWLGLALVYSDNKWDEYDREKASIFVEKAYQAYTQIGASIPDAWWLHIYGNLHSGLVYRNLGQNEKALEKLELALSYAKQTGNIQNQAQAFNGLATVYRNQNNFEQAIEYHNQAKEILQSIGAKVDLAEVYYQMGLTFQKIGNIKKSKEILQEAIRLYYQIGASKLITKLQNLMETINKDEHNSKKA